tara:strand:- start:365 stop:1270 length:906 start_codon:yes stop_codon:yes gene_type:complete
MLINFDEHSKKLNDFRKGKLPEALTLGHTEFDSHFRFVQGNMNFILGHNNVGKTHFTFYLMLLYTLKHKIRWLVFSSENDVYSLLKKLIEFIEGKPINKIEQKDYEDSLKFVYDHFKFIDCNQQYTYKQLLALAKSIKDAWDYHGLLIDPINSLRKNIKLGSNAYEHSYEQLTDIRIFCKTNNITTWICAHAVTEALRRKHLKGHEFEGQIPPPSVGDSEGGAVNANRADDFLVIHRYIYSPDSWMYTRLFSCKIKMQELGYKPTSYESPLMFRSILNNVGFEISGENLIKYRTKKQINLL